MSTLESDQPLILVSYDVLKGSRVAAARVAHLIFGRKDVRSSGRRPFIERPGVVWIGQSVFILPVPDAEELAGRLRAMGAVVTTASIAVDLDGIEAFRSRGRWARLA
jgi:hypothetical protein